MIFARSLTMILLILGAIFVELSNAVVQECKAAPPLPQTAKLWYLNENAWTSDRMPTGWTSEQADDWPYPNTIVTAKIDYYPGGRKYTYTINKRPKTSEPERQFIFKPHTLTFDRYYYLSNFESCQKDDKTSSDQYALTMAVYEVVH